MPARKSFKHQFSGLTRAAAQDAERGAPPQPVLAVRAQGRAGERPPLRHLLPLLNILLLLSLSLCVTRDEFRAFGQIAVSLVFFFPTCVGTGHAKTFKAAGWVGGSWN